MEWRDDGLILGTRKHGETSVIVEAMTRAHGRHFGLVRGGRSKRMQPLLQTGNLAEFVWRARLDEHLGTFSVEPVELRTARLMASAEALHAVCLVAALLRLAAERDPHPALYETAVGIAGSIEKPESLPPLIVRFEAAILVANGVRPRSFGMRRHRHHQGSRLCVAEIRTGRLEDGGGSL